MASRSQNLPRKSDANVPMRSVLEVIVYLRPLVFLSGNAARQESRKREFRTLSCCKYADRGRHYFYRCCCDDYRLAGDKRAERLIDSNMDILAHFIGSA